MVTAVVFACQMIHVIVNRETTVVLVVSLFWDVVLTIITAFVVLVVMIVRRLHMRKSCIRVRVVYCTSSIVGFIRNMTPDAVSLQRIIAHARSTLDFAENVRTRVSFDCLSTNN